LATVFRRLVEAIPPAQAQETVGEVLEGLKRFQSGDSINLPATVIVAVGVSG
jgi:hypothetical protein